MVLSERACILSRSGTGTSRELSSATSCQYRSLWTSKVEKPFRKAGTSTALPGSAWSLKNRMFRGSRDLRISMNHADPSASQVVLPGRYFVRLESSSSGGGIGGERSSYYIDRIQSGKTDVLADGFTIQAGVAPPPLEVYLHAGGGTIAGRLRTEGRKPAFCRVLLLRETTNGVIPAFVFATNGEFSSGALAPGEYLAWAWEGDEVIEYRNPQALSTW